MIRIQKARLYCAWSFQDNKKTQCVTTLGIPPVESPNAELRASIEAEIKEKRR